MMLLKILRTKLLEDDAVSLTSARDRMRQNIEDTATTERILEQTLNDQEALRTELHSLETATPVQLERLQLSAKKATKDADSLRERLAGNTSEVSDLESKIVKLSAARNADATSALEILRRCNSAAVMCTRGQFAIDLSTRVDRQNPRNLLGDIDQGPLGDLLLSTSAMRILEDRTRRTDRIQASATDELLALLDEFLAQPIPDLVQNEPLEIGFDERGFLQRA